MKTTFYLIAVLALMTACNPSAQNEEKQELETESLVEENPEELETLEQEEDPNEVEPKGEVEPEGEVEPAGEVENLD